MKKDLTIYIILFGVVGILIYNHFFFDLDAEESPVLVTLNDLQKEALSTINEMTKLLISLSTALFGLIGYFALENFKSVGKIENKFRIDLTLAFCSVALSIDFGYIFMEKLVELLSNGIFQPYDKLLILPRKLQIISFLVSLLFAGRLIYRSLFKTD